MVLKIKSTSRISDDKERAMKEIAEERMVKLTINIPKSTQLAFKVITTRNGTNMTDTLLDFIKQYIQV